MTTHRHSIGGFAATALLATAMVFGQAGAEDLIPFNPATAQAQQIDGSWKVVTDGNHWLLDFGSSAESARKAVAVIAHYGPNAVGYVGRPNPGMEYYLVNGAAPAGPCDGEDAIPFNPANVEAKCIQNSWKVVDGEHWMLDFGDGRQQAEEALGIIKKYGFTHICFGGRCTGSRPMMYFRKDAAAPVKPAQAAPAETKPSKPAAPAAGTKARLRVTVMEGQNTLAVNPSVSLQRLAGPDNAVETRTENPAVFEVEPGTCAVSAKVGTGEATAPREIALQAGETKEITLRTGTGTAEITLVAGGQPVLPCPNIELRSGGKLVSAASQSPARFQVTEGIYTLRVVVNSSQLFEAGDVAVAAGETAAKTVELPMGALSVRVTGTPYGPGGKLPYVEVDAGGKMIAALVDSPAKFQLLAGPYDLCVLDNGVKKGTQAVTVEAGKTKEITLNVQAP